MMGPKQEAQAALFYGVSLEARVPQDHLLRSIDRFVDLSDIRQYRAEFYSHPGCLSVDPERLVRMLLVGYCFGIRSERRLCEEVHLKLCQLNLSLFDGGSNPYVVRGKTIGVRTDRRLLYPEAVKKRNAQYSVEMDVLFGECGSPCTP
jgi:hypothetical protein